MSVATTVRPSSLPLPKTISRSSPAERLKLKSGVNGTSSKENSPNLYRANLLLPTHQRVKLSSTSSSTGSSSPTTTPTYERQVKSLTPERDLTSKSTGRSTSLLRKASNASRALSAKNSDQPATPSSNMAVTTNNNAKSAPSNKVTSNRRVVANNAKNTAISSKSKGTDNNLTADQLYATKRCKNFSPF